MVAVAFLYLELNREILISKWVCPNMDKELLPVSSLAQDLSQTNEREELIFKAC